MCQPVSSNTFSLGRLKNPNYQILVGLSQSCDWFSTYYSLELLKKTDRLIIDIAPECGFSSHSHLSKQFRQLTGMTPKAYRLS